MWDPEGKAVGVKPAESPVESARKITQEMEKWSDELAGKPRWLVLNKIDRLQQDDVEKHCQAIVDELNWKGPVYRISALKGDGTRGLMFAIMDFLELRRQQDNVQG